MALVIKTNLQDEDLGAVSREEAHRGNGILHRAIVVIVKTKEGKYLLAARCNKKQLWPETFDLSIATHPKNNESYEESAKRRLSEELGLNVNQVKSLGVFSYFVKQGENCENEFCRVFLAEVDENSINFNPEEISHIVFCDKNEILRLCSEGKLTPWANLVILGGYLD
ncbi:NUDIX domain-containing protein [Candidatus Pacearchaeota archaeon]|nr:NUDIX domain-containing protein [Candidatus Pacearchaeota archaeon]